ncbi:hypothetical protein B0O99DRAFT_100816 [Bisporella sp. PMI_857]|nr:hypothetical protein B0O99DRAFT_100816 [Bisporella sp. PMI_857]
MRRSVQWSDRDTVYMAREDESACRSTRNQYIQSSVRANDPSVVLPKLEVKPCTPTPGTTQWNPKTPSNPTEVEAQSTLIRDRI